NCAFKVLPRHFIERAQLRSTGALLGAELLSEARRMGLSVGEVGVTHRPRRGGTPTGAYPAVIFRAFSELFSLMRSRVGRPTRPLSASSDQRVAMERGVARRPAQPRR